MNLYTEYYLEISSSIYVFDNCQEASVLYNAIGVLVTEGL